MARDGSSVDEFVFGFDGDCVVVGLVVRDDGECGVCWDGGGDGCG